MPKQPNLSPAGFVVLALFVGILVYNFWLYLLGFLALCGAYYLLENHRKIP